MIRSTVRSAAVVAMLLGFLASVAPAAAQDAAELQWSGSAQFEVLPDLGRVDVVFSYFHENVTEGVEFPGFFESLPADAADVAAHQNDRELEIILLGEADGFATWFIAFEEPLEIGDTAEVRLTWSIISSALPGPLIAPGVAAFDVFRPGPEGSDFGTIHVSVVFSYEPVVELNLLRGSGAISTYEMFMPPYEAIRIELRDVELFETSTLSLPPPVDILSWPDDGWRIDVEGRATEVAQRLDAWFGALDRRFAIRRTFPGDDHLAVELDLVELSNSSAAAVDHQLAHAWLDDVRVDESWFIEGLALGFAGQLGEPGSEEAVIADLVGELGSDGVRAVVDALRAETSPYPGATPSPRVLTPGWQTLLDLIERVGGVDDAATAFRATVTADLGDALIDRRAAALLDYEALEARSGGWALPAFLRDAMASWDFDTFTERQAEVSDVIVTRDNLAAWAETLELPARSEMQLSFELAEDDLTEVVSAFEARGAALMAFDEAEAAVNGDRGLLARVGLWGSDPDGELAELRLAWADADDALVEDDGHALTASVEGAVGRGTIRLLIPAATLLGLWQLLRLVRQRAAARSVSEDDQSEKMSA
jgi:hypothetical protein